MIQIPCELIVRMAPLVRRATDPKFKMLRLENGIVIACDRRLLSVEKLVTDFQGVCNLDLTDELVEQCRTEAALSGVLQVIPNDMLQFTTVKSSYGWTNVGNIGIYMDVSDGIGRWREVINQCVDPLQTAGVGSAMVWNAKDIATLAATSPTGEVAFERIIDPNQRPTLMRDIACGEWVGCFLPRIPDGVFHPPAELPVWVR